MYQLIIRYLLGTCRILTEWLDIQNHYDDDWDPRIVNGWMAKHGQFTYMARIKSDVICGGALITWRHVLTAAHCIVTTPSTTRTVIKPKARFRIHLGDHSKKKKDHKSNPGKTS